MRIRRNNILRAGVLLLTIAVVSALFWLRNITGKILIPRSSSVHTSSINQYMTNKKPFNILLLGYGGGTHDGAYLTDSMVVVHIDPAQRKAFLISIPRDIWIKIPTDGPTSGYWKINAAYTIGMDDKSYPNKQAQFKGPAGPGHMAEYVVSQVTGLPIQYFVGIDFSGFVKTIDTLGGVDINVETAFDDYEYPVDGHEDDLCGHTQSELPQLAKQSTQSAAYIVFPCRYEHLHFVAGMQHMDGTTALKYVRSRHSLQDGTDFGRSKRQRNLITAVKQKVASVGFIPKIIPFMNGLGDDAKTDFTLDDIKELLKNFSVLNKYQIETLALTDQNYLTDSFSADGQAILQPKDGLDNWTGVHNWISNKISGINQPAKAIVQVTNGTLISGLAGLASNRLKNAGLDVLEPTTNSQQNVKTTQIISYDRNISPNELNILKKEFGNSTITVSPPDSKNKYNILIVVGEDYNLQQGKKLLNE